MFRRAFGLSLLFIVAAAVLLACNLLDAFTTRPTVVIRAPKSGSEFREGESVSVESRSSDSSGIVRVELSVDDKVVRSDPAPGGPAAFEIAQAWKATAGAHSIRIRSYNKSGAESATASISITVRSLTSAAPGLSETPSVTGTISAACTPNAAFVLDVTVPDGTSSDAGQPFDKVWRVRNTGTCAWGPGYQLVPTSGETMSATVPVAIPVTEPGATADLAVTMIAPASPGAHRGVWRLKSPDGQLFGSAVNVTIQVQEPPPSVTPAPTDTPVPAGCSGAPIVNSFAVSPTTIMAGQSATLNWGLVANADRAEISPGIGGIGTPGSTSISPSTTTTYVLTARCGTITTTQQVILTVNSPALSITGAAASVTPNSSITCPATFLFTGGITGSGAGIVTYRWERSDGTSTAVQSVNFAGPGTVNVTNQWTVATPLAGWQRLHVLVPNDITSNQAAFTVTCSSPFQVTNVIASVSPSTYIGSCPASFNFTGEITANGSGTVTYRWERSDGQAGPSQTIDFGGIGSRTVATLWAVAAPSAGWEKIHITAPNDVLSSQAAFTNNCH